jgi:hypothetical protein
MGLLKRLLGQSEAPPRPGLPESWAVFVEPLAPADSKLLAGDETLHVVGESFYQDALWALVGTRSRDQRVSVNIVAILVCEDDNAYDENAVSVWIYGKHVGHLSRENAALYRGGILALESEHGCRVALNGVISGGGMHDDGPGMLGVFLHHDPTHFGLPSTRVERQMDTGFRDALRTDQADDSYDLSWFRDMPEDPVRAISYLRSQLESETDPIDRHFMFHHLEATLYRSRDAFASALADYDQVCEEHDAEMGAIRAALFAKWGKVPSFQTYRQQCIRQAKAKNFERALWWAERGLVLYGEDCGREEAVEDLRKRADSFRAKLAKTWPED